jgi:hypothetical protein
MSNPNLDALTNQVLQGSSATSSTPSTETALTVSGSGSISRETQPMPTFFGFSNPEQALSGEATGFPGLPPLDQSQSNCMLTPQQKMMLDRKQICCIMMKRVSKWFQDNGCPVIISPYDSAMSCSR